MEKEKFKIIDKGEIEPIFFKKNDLKLFKDWLKENYSCMTCRDRCLEKGWTEEEIEKIYKIVNQIT